MAREGEVVTDAERDRIVKELEKFDPSDDYHRNDGETELGYYAAIDRAVHLIRGNIATWTDPKPKRGRAAP